MIWDDVRKQSPLLRNPSIQVIKVPFGISGVVASKDRPINYDSALLNTLVPRTGTGKIDTDWIRYPFEQFVIVSEKDDDICIKVSIHTNQQMRDYKNAEPQLWKSAWCDTAEWIFEAVMIARNGGTFAVGVCASGAFYSDGLMFPDWKTLAAGATISGLQQHARFKCALEWGMGTFKVKNLNGDETEEDYITVMAQLMSVTLATMALMSTKNITKVLCQPPRQQRRHAERHGLLPPVSWHELVIHPMHKHGSSQGTGSCEPLALHWVRGHWKDYREHGLFGREKSKGMYWWSPHLAGQADRVVHKDYVIAP